MTTPRAIRIGIIGLGAVAQSVHLPLLRRRPELFTVTAISDISPSLTAAVGALFGIADKDQHSTTEDLLDRGDLDAILICSGGSHEPIVTAALERNIAVLCEKPLAFTHAEISRIRQALPTSGFPKLMVGYMKQYDPATTCAREILTEVDDIRTVDVSVLHPTGQSQLDFANLATGSGDVPQDIREEFGRTDQTLREIAFGAGNGSDELWSVYAGCVLSSLTHDLSVLRTVFSPIDAIEYTDIWRRQSTKQRRTTGRDAGGLGQVPPSIRTLGTFQDTSRFVLDWHYVHDYPAYRETIKVIYGSGSIELTFPSPYLLHAPTVLTQFSAVGETEARTEFRSTAEAFELQLEAFADMLHNGTPPHTDIVGAEQDITISQAIVARYAERTGIVLSGELGAALIKSP